MNDNEKAIEILENIDIEANNGYSEEDVKHAYLMGILALKQQLNNGWIPCSERLPDNKVNVLITKESGTVKVGFCNVNYNEWREDGYLICPPIAWQPLPERYKEKLDEE